MNETIEMIDHSIEMELHEILIRGREFHGSDR